MKIHFGFFVIGLVGIANQTLFAGEDPIRLLYKPQVHSSTRYDAVSVVKQKMSVPNKSVESEAVTNMSFAIDAKESLLSRTTMEFKCTSATMQLIMTGLATPTGGRIEEIEDVVGRSSTLTITPDGREVSNSIDTSMGGIEAFSELLSSTKILRRLFMPLSDADVVPGSTWKHELVDTIESPQKMGAIVTTGTINVSFVEALDTFGMECWKIVSVGDELIQTGTYSSGTTAMTQKGKGTFRCVSLHDSRTGMLVHSMSTMSTHANMELKGQYAVNLPVDYEVTLQIKQRSEGDR